MTCPVFGYFGMNSEPFRWHFNNISIFNTDHFPHKMTFFTARHGHLGYHIIWKFSQSVSYVRFCPLWSIPGHSIALVVYLTDNMLRNRHGILMLFPEKSYETKLNTIYFMIDHVKSQHIMTFIKDISIPCSYNTHRYVTDISGDIHFLCTKSPKITQNHLYSG